MNEPDFQDTTTSPEIKDSEFKEVDAVVEADTRSTTSASTSRNENKAESGARIINEVYKSFKEDKPFAGLVVSIVGYIVIASFGGMNSVGTYGGYILFLAIAYLFYKFLEKSLVVYFESKILALVIAVLFIALMWTNFSLIEDGFLWVHDSWQEFYRNSKG